MAKKKRRVRTDGYTVYPDISKTKLGNFLIGLVLILGIGAILLKQFAPSVYNDLENKITHVFSDDKTTKSSKGKLTGEVAKSVALSGGEVDVAQSLNLTMALEQTNKSMVIIVNDNVPYFSEDDIELDSEINKKNRALFEERQSKDNLDYYELNKEGFTADKYAWELLSELDSKNRAGQANAMLSSYIQPTAEREGLRVNPSGWNQQKTKAGKTVYDRAHLVGYQFTGHNNELRNLMTGTSDFNKMPGMLAYETQVADALKKGVHVRYRVTPLFYGDELIARGVEMEAYSVEDKGKTVSFHVIIRNIIQENGNAIDYSNSKVKYSK